MKHYVVRLNCPAYMWALVEVEAKDADHAQELALAENERGNVSFEFSGLDASDAEVTAVEELEGGNGEV